MDRRYLAIALALLACACRAHSPRARPASPPERALVTFEGMCDASGAVPVSGTLFAVADDEDNVLRTYDAARGGAPLSSIDISAAAGLLPKEDRQPGDEAQPAPEIDIEAATRLGEFALWIGSHGRNSSGKLKRERLRMFATRLGAGEVMRVVGSSYDGLLDALNADPRYTRFSLQEAATLSPKKAGGLNIEGLAARPTGGVWVGFRSPTPQGHALLAGLENPLEVMDGAPVQIGPPHLLNLNGLGVRDIVWSRDRYWIIAGSPSDEGLPSALYAWDGRGAPQKVEAVDLSDLNPEALFAPPELEHAMVLSDDGSRDIDGSECKKLRDPDKKRFRGAWLRF